MSEKYKSINKVAIATIAGTIGIELVNFILIPIMTRALGTSGYGTISIYTAWCAIIMAVCGLQTTQSIVYIIAEKEKKIQKDYFASMLACSAMCFGICALIFAAIGVIFNGVFGFPTLLVVILFLQSFGNYAVNYANTIFNQEQKPIKQVILSLIVAISTALMAIWLVFQIKSDDLKYIGRILGYAIPYFVIGFGLACYFIVPNLKNIRISYIRELLPLCLPIIIHALAGNVFSQSDRVMLGYLSDSSAAGIYSFAYSIAALLSVAWVTLNSFYQPFFFAYMKNNDVAMVEEKTRNLIELYTCGYVVFLFIVPELMTIYGGHNFSGAVQYLPVLSLGIYYNFLYVFNSNYEIYYKKTKNIAMATVFSAIINFSLNAMLIPKYSIMGAAAATLISYLALFLIHLSFALHISKTEKVPYVFKVKHFVMGGTVAVLTTILYGFLKPYFIIRILVGVVVFFYILWKMIRRRSII